MAATTFESSQAPDPIRLLFVDDEPAYRRHFCAGLRADRRFVVETAGNGEEGLARFKTFRPQIVFTDLRMPVMDGLELLREIKLLQPEVFVLVLTGVDSAREAVEAMKSGAYDYLVKPLDLPMVKRIIEKILSHSQLLEKNRHFSEESGTRFENIVGQDPKMFEIYEKIRQVAPTDASVLITGESGTGKELIARAIHARSRRCDRPFVAVNCAALPEGLIQSELFGHEKGAFTGAAGRKKGFFEQADGGTIFLDEIGDIPLLTQVSLLRVLELGCFHRVGGTETVRIDTRLICATHQDLTLSIREKIFREDLYYRINVVAIHSPPLRERASDIPLLSQHFLEKFAASAGKPIRGFSRDAVDRLAAYSWPGNVRELSHAVEHAVIFCPAGEITPEHLPDEVRFPDSSVPPRRQPGFGSLQQTEEELIRRVLLETNWNLSQAAAELKIARGTLYSKMKRYGIMKTDAESDGF